MNQNDLRGWLLQQPKPAMIRVTVDGETEELKPGKSWAKTAATIAALEPDLLQAYDAAGKLLRATKVEVEATPRRGSPQPPALPAALATDPHAVLLHHFATLLAHAYEHSTEVAFVKLVEVVERQGDRSEAIEQRLERAEARARRLQEDQVEDAYDRAEQLAVEAQAGNGDDALKQHLVSAFMSGQLQRGPNGAGKTNGAAAPSKAKS
jgi:hypothetical protein